MQPQTAQSSGPEGGQHPGYPAGPGLIEGCLSQTGGGYAVRSSEGGKQFSLELDPQMAQNLDVKRDVANAVGKQVKIYGYPSASGTSSSTASGAATSPQATTPSPAGDTTTPQATTPPAAGLPQADTGMTPAGGGGANAANSAQEAGAAGQSAANSAMAGGTQSPAATGANAFQVTRFIPLNTPCGTGTSQGAQPGNAQNAAE
jgi:hypothetical protein